MGGQQRIRQYVRSGQRTRSCGRMESDIEKGTLICKEKIQKIALYPYKYPVNLEKEAKEALLNKDAKRLKKIFSDTGIIAGNFHVPRRGGQGGGVSELHWF